MERSVCNVSVTSIELHKLLTKFLESEEQDTPQIWSEEETSRKRIFQETTTRYSDGRFVVTLPLKMDGSSLGESRMQAERRFHSLECKFSRNESFKKDYVNFLREGLYSSQIGQSSLWWNGPEYLMLDKRDWLDMMIKKQRLSQSSKVKKWR
nr:unnamed protein product [Callosobruchus analis]